MSTQVAEKPAINQPEQAKTPETKTPEQVKPNFGEGRYSKEMERIYDALIKSFGVDVKRAEKIARQAGSDAGAVFRNASASISVSKTTKDGKTTIGDASKVKGVTMTNPLACVRAIQWMNDAGPNFVSFGHTKWKFTDELTKWIDALKID